MKNKVWPEQTNHLKLIACILINPKKDGDLKSPYQFFLLKNNLKINSMAFPTNASFKKLCKSWVWIEGEPLDLVHKPSFGFFAIDGKSFLGELKLLLHAGV